MTPEQFCYWLQGFFEMSPDNNELTPEQVMMIREHLKTVFNKITPNMDLLKGILDKDYPPIRPTIIC